MHLLIDIRLGSPSDTPLAHYGVKWGHFWKAYHPHDHITFLTHTGEEIPWESCIWIASWFRFFGKRLAAHDHGPDRIISFSRLPSIDSSIPTLLHRGDLREYLYDEKSKSWLISKLRLYTEERTMKKASAIIVPWREVGMDLVEMYGIDESRIHVLPYLHDLVSKPPEKKSMLTYGLGEDYYITEVTPTEEWQPLELIQSYAHYIHDSSGSEELVLLGDLGTNFGMIVALIRSLDLLQKVKILWVLQKDERESLYSDAKGWIALGRYYSRWPALALAEEYGLPLFLSEIVGLRDHEASYIHPNSTNELVQKLSVKQKKPSHSTTDNEQILHLYARIIAW